MGREGEKEEEREGGRERGGERERARGGSSEAEGGAVQRIVLDVNWTTLIHITSNQEG